MADGELTVRVGGEAWSMPAGGDIRVVLDGPVLEVSSSAGVLGAAILPAGDHFVVESADGRLESHELER